MGQHASGCGQSKSGRLRSLIAIIFLAFLLACSGGPDSSDPENNYCLMWNGSALEWAVNIGGYEWYTDLNQWPINDLKPGTHESYIRATDGSDTPLRFAIVVRSGEEPEIISKE